MKRRLSFLLLLALAVLVTVGCRQTPPVTPAQVAEPTQTPATAPVSAGDLPALMGSRFIT